MENQPRKAGKIELWRVPDKHEPSYAAWILEHLTQIALLCGEEVTAARFNLMVSELQRLDYEPKHLLRAFRALRERAKFFPRPGDIYEYIQRAKSEIELPTGPRPALWEERSAG